jgi:WD40 repeat protein
MIRLWELATGQELKCFSNDSPTRHPLAFSPDGKLVAVGGYDCIIHLWNPSTGKEVGPGSGKISPVGWLAFLPGRKSLISKSRYDEKFRFWNPLTGQEKKQEFDFGEPQDWAISQDGKTLAVLGSSAPKKGDPSIRIWDVEKNREIRRFAPSEKKFKALELSAHGALLAAGGEDSNVQIWNVSTGKEVRTLGQDLGMNDKWRLGSLDISPDGSMLVMKRFYYGAVVRIGMNPSWPNEMYFWDLSTGKKLDRFEKFKKWCDWVVFSPDSKTMVTTGERSHYHLYFWDVATGEELRTVENEKMFLTCIFSPAGRTLATGMEDGTVLLWEAASGKIRRTLKGHRGPVYSLSFSDDGQLLASECSDGTALIWDLYGRASKNEHPR